MRNSEANHDAGHARERIAEILRGALGTPEEDALEDETRRLMLHLSIEPLANAAPVPDEAAPHPRKPLLRRLLGKQDGDMRA
ncbi:hypothetical protein BXU08_02110 [Sphingomonas sp. LM7]|nr:hypothetical protein BXU08_02110 [Sphingomonas sp. LM7]